jgi:hypothetical protein
MHAEEQRLQEALAGQARYDSAASDVQELARAAAARANVDGPRVRDLLYVVAATAEQRG